jgi:hypothetical protein
MVNPHNVLEIVQKHFHSNPVKSDITAEELHILEVVISMLESKILPYTDLDFYMPENYRDTDYNDEICSSSAVMSDFTGFE